MTRPTWAEYGLSFADVAKSRAACTRRQVGAAILDPLNSVVSTGYNGVPRGELNCSDGGCPRGLLSYDECPAYGSYNNCRGKHAEVNAIEDAHRRGLSVEGCTIYVTWPPCNDCSVAIREAGIEQVIWPEGS